ncbi:MAG: hypothetical protein JWN48_5907 [Myxococcaceae bacterium]|nr:hypothetical protein [Myxococcaceae bacterium]
MVGKSSVRVVPMIDLAPVIRPLPNAREPSPRWLLVAMLALSLFLHLGTLLLSLVILRPPELDMEFELPLDVEFGTSEELAVAQAAAPVASAASGEPGTSGTTGSGGDAGARDASVDDAGVSDAARADGGSSDAGPSKPRARDAGMPVASVLPDAGASAARLPPGAQIALRVDMTRIRKSPVAGDVRSLLSAIPDWKALLEGSGIDPIEQIDRLLIATPNLQREKIVLAGRYFGGEQVVRDAVARLGAAKGEAVPWHSEGNVQVAPWANQDATPRVIALVGPQHFAISRAEDLPRVLAIASVRAQRGRKTRAPREQPADALLSMEDDEGLSLEIEGATQFVRRGRRGVPDRLRLSIIETPNLRAEVRGVFSYADEALAADGLSYLTELRDRYASNTLVALLGLSEPLESASVARQDNEVRIVLTLSVEQMRLIMGYVRELVSPPAARGP